MLVDGIKSFFDRLGAEWVLWLLLGLSMVSIAVIVERALFFYRNRVDAKELSAEILTALRRGGEQEAMGLVATVPGMAGAVLRAALNAYHDGVGAMEEVILASITLERSRYDRFLGILGTLGNNAPFIGLFGTVIGIINAFAQLAGALAGQAQKDLVMDSIAEALVATAVGLAVAIPAVIAFNTFKARVKSVSANTEWLARNVLAHLKAVGNGEQRRDGLEEA